MWPQVIFGDIRNADSIFVEVSISETRNLEYECILQSWLLALIQSVVLLTATRHKTTRWCHTWHLAMGAVSVRAAWLQWKVAAHTLAIPAFLLLRLRRRRRRRWLEHAACLASSWLYQFLVSQVLQRISKMLSTWVNSNVVLSYVATASCYNIDNVHTYI